MSAFVHPPHPVILRKWMKAAPLGKLLEVEGVVSASSCHPFSDFELPSSNEGINLFGSDEL
jgi:hypothetical protein